MEKPWFLLFLILLPCGIFAQSQDEVRTLVQQGVELHEKGDYHAAIQSYEQALQLDKKSDLALYEIAYSYYALKNYKQTLKYVNKVIKMNKGSLQEAYLIKGSTLDDMGNPKKAIDTYLEAIDHFPEQYLLHYNLGLTYYKQGEFSAAESALQEGILANPAHPSGHYLLGSLKFEQGQRVPSLLAIYFFLMLEPNTDRSDEALALIDRQMRQGVSRKEGKTLEILLNAGKENEFSSIDLMISMMEATQSIVQDAQPEIEKELGGPVEITKTEEVQFYDQMESIVGMLAELQEEKTGFYWDLYATMFTQIKESGHLEAFAYYITQAKGKSVTDWMDTHKPEMEALFEWFQSDN